MFGCKKEGKSDVSFRDGGFFSYCDGCYCSTGKSVRWHKLCLCENCAKKDACHWEKNKLNKKSIKDISSELEELKKAVEEAGLIIKDKQSESRFKIVKGKK